MEVNLFVYNKSLTMKESTNIWLFPIYIFLNFINTKMYWEKLN